MFQSRWGFHPCDDTTYRKLKLLNHAYFKALQMARVWERWKRKDPHNRVMRRRLRNDQGWVIGYESPVLIAEPPLCLLFTTKVLVTRHFDKKGTYVRGGFEEEAIVTTDPGIAFDYRAARRPMPDASAVPALRLSAEAIDGLYQQAQQWMQESRKLIHEPVECVALGF